MRTNRKLSPEHKLKISESLKGDKNPNFGKSLPSSYRKKISEGLLRYWQNVP